MAKHHHHRHAMQVEARVRQLEGRDLGAAAVAANPGGPAKYDKSRSAGLLLASTQPAYATDADMQLGDDDAAVPAADATAAVAVNGTAAPETDGAVAVEKKEKKKKVCFASCGFAV